MGGRNEKDFRRGRSPPPIICNVRLPLRTRGIPKRQVGQASTLTPPALAGELFSNCSSGNIGSPRTEAYEKKFPFPCSFALLHGSSYGPEHRVVGTPEPGNKEGRRLCPTGQHGRAVLSGKANCNRFGLPTASYLDFSQATRTQRSPVS